MKYVVILTVTQYSNISFYSKNQVIQHGRIVHPNIWHHWLMFILIFHFLEKIAPAALADIFPNLSFSCENSSY